MYSTVVSDVGTVRSNNQDSAFAGEHLIAICDGMGGHAGGDTASTIAIRSLAHIEQDNVQGDVQIIAHMMETSVMAAHDAIVGKAKRGASQPEAVEDIFPDEQPDDQLRSSWSHYQRPR